MQALRWNHAFNIPIQIKILLPVGVGQAETAIGVMENVHLAFRLPLIILSRVIFGDFGFCHKTNNGGTSWSQGYVDPAGQRAGKCRYAFGIKAPQVVHRETRSCLAGRMDQCK